MGDALSVPFIVSWFGTEIFTFTLLAISLVTRFTCADERPLSVFTQQISVTVMGITCALVYI